MLLSGQDYPIKSNEYILDFLSEQYPKPLIDHERVVEGSWAWPKFSVYKWINRIDAVQKKLKKGLLRSSLVAFFCIANFIETRIIGSPRDNLIKHNISLYGGSAWWILPHCIIDYVTDQLSSNKRIIREFKRVFTPEELFFQTLAMNSPYSVLINENDDIYTKGDQQCMTFANFITPTKSFRGHPHIITDEDFDRIMAKKALFARKFDMNVCQSVMDKIDNETQC